MENYCQNSAVNYGALIYVDVTVYGMGPLLQINGEDT